MDVQKCNYSSVDFLGLVEEIYEKGGAKEMLTVFTRQAKSIWMRWNGVIHGEVFTDLNELVWVTTQVLDDFIQANLSTNQIAGQERLAPS